MCFRHRLQATVASAAPTTSPTAGMDGDWDDGDSDGDLLCDDTCEFAFDGECDDGGFDASTDACEFGTDCTDCGPRSLSDWDDGDWDDG